MSFSDFYGGVVGLGDAYKKGLDQSEAPDLLRQLLGSQGQPATALAALGGGQAAAPAVSNGLAARRGDCEAEYARAARALVVCTGVALPAGFTGFGDEPDHAARDAALEAAPVRFPAWAHAEVARAA